MAISTYEGIVKDGQIRLHDDIKLPEHIKVYVVIPDYEGSPQAHIHSPRLVHREQAADFVKQVVELEADGEV